MRRSLFFDCVATACGHRFCAGCIRDAVDCPLCGADVTPLTPDAEAQGALRAAFCRARRCWLCCCVAVALLLLCTAIFRKAVGSCCFLHAPQAAARVDRYIEAHACSHTVWELEGSPAGSAGVDGMAGERGRASFLLQLGLRAIAAGNTGVG